MNAQWQQSNLPSLKTTVSLSMHSPTLEAPIHAVL